MLSAQESDIFKSILKEARRPKLSMDLLLDFSDSILFRKRLDATKDYLPHVGFNYGKDSLFFSYMEFIKSQKSSVISPYLTFSNKGEDNTPESVGVAVVDIVVTPLASIIMLNPIAFFNYLMQTGILPNEPFVPRPSRKERMLKTITQDVYHINDY